MLLPWTLLWRHQLLCIHFCICRWWSYHWRNFWFKYNINTSKNSILILSLMCWCQLGVRVINTFETVIGYIPCKLHRCIIIIERINEAILATHGNHTNAIINVATIHFRNRAVTQIQLSFDPLNAKINPLSPPARWGPSRGRSQCSGNIASFRCISSNLIITRLLYRFNRHPTPTMPKSTPCLLPARWGPRALDSQYSGNIAIFWWISSNFIKTQLSIQNNR